MRFRDKVAIVTGAARGIGEAYARALFVTTDVGSPETATASAATAMEKFGRIDCLVNNAALFGGMRLDPLVTVDLAYYRRFMDINMDGALHMTRAVLPHMCKQGGAIVNQTSTAAHMAYGMYSVAKYALNGLTFALAREQLAGILATMPLARLEARIALEEILAAAPDFSVDEAGLERMHSPQVRGYTRVPLRFTPVAS